jgi:hypothetical protein
VSFAGGRTGLADYASRCGLDRGLGRGFQGDRLGFGQIEGRLYGRNRSSAGRLGGLLRGRFGRGRRSQLLDGFPDSRSRDLPIGELRYRLDAGKAVPNLQKALAVRADGAGKLLFSGKHGGASLFGGLFRGVQGDAVVRIDRKVLHFRLISLARCVRRRSHSSLGSARKASRIFGLAMVRRSDLTSRQMSSDDRPRNKIRTEDG